MEEQNSFYEAERRSEQTGISSDEGLRRYTAKTFLILFFGLAVSFGVALFIAYTWPGYYLILDLLQVTGGYLHLILLAVQLALSWAMSAGIRKASVGVTWALFLAHCALIGFVVGTWLLLYSLESATLIFALTALYFGGMAVIGFLTRIDLSRARPILLGGLLFLIVSNLLMALIPALDAADQVICSIGVVLFLAYTAYDTQMIRRFYEAFRRDEEMLRKASVYAALELCLDFVNLFLYLLRLLGRRSKR